MAFPLHLVVRVVGAVEETEAVLRELSSLVRHPHGPGAVDLGPGGGGGRTPWNIPTQLVWRVAASPSKRFAWSAAEEAELCGEFCVTCGDDLGSRRHKDAAESRSGLAPGSLQRLSVDALVHHLSTASDEAFRAFVEDVPEIMRDETLSQLPPRLVVVWTRRRQFFAGLASASRLAEPNGGNGAGDGTPADVCIGGDGDGNGSDGDRDGDRGEGAWPDFRARRELPSFGRVLDGLSKEERYLRWRRLECARAAGRSAVARAADQPRSPDSCDDSGPGESDDDVSLSGFQWFSDHAERLSRAYLLEALVERCLPASQFLSFVQLVMRVSVRCPGVVIDLLKHDSNDAPVYIAFKGGRNGPARQCPCAFSLSDQFLRESDAPAEEGWVWERQLESRDPFLRWFAVGPSWPPREARRRTAANASTAPGDQASSSDAATAYRARIMMP